MYWREEIKMTYKVQNIAQSRKVVRSSSGVSLELWKEGAFFGIYFKDIMVNLFQGNYLTGGWTNLFLTKVDESNNRSVVSLIDRQSLYAYQTNAVLYSRVDEDFYAILRVSLDNENPIIYFDVSIEALRPVKLSPCLFMDLGLAPRGHVASNELYNSHYIDHSVFAHIRHGKVVCSRQTQNVGGHPWVMIASTDKGVRYCTNGLEFWGKGVKKQKQAPHFLTQNTKGSIHTQGELSSVALESTQIELQKSELKSLRFVMFLEENHEQSSHEDDMKRLDQLSVEKERALFQFASVKADMEGSSFQYVGHQELQSLSLSQEEVEKRWPIREYEEYGEEGALLSFFTKNHRHIVLQEKELVQERSTGTVLASGSQLALEEESLSVTNYMAGSFASQLTVGNTSFHRITAVNKQPLFLSPMTSLWICVHYQGEWKRLKLPSAFEMSPYGCRWIYQLESNEVEVKTHVGLRDHYYALEVKVKGEPLRVRIFSEYLMGSEEGNAQYSYEIVQEENAWILTPEATSMWGQKHPQSKVKFQVKTSQKLNIQDDRLLFHDYKKRGLPIIGVDINQTNEVSVCCQVDLEGQTREVNCKTYEEVIDESEKWLGQKFKLSEESTQSESHRIMKALPWFIHNMIIHMKVPRGLEQFSGAAWGVRDVSQGPVEGLLSMRLYEDTKKILERLFEHQRSVDGNWPQWFMFDEYKDIQAGESHGDVILWPVKAVSTYIQESNDQNFWSQKVGYDGEGKNPQTILEHCLQAFKFVKEHSVGETYLPAYLDGDWNDSLQPNSHEERENMVSAWTTALLYQTLSQIIKVLPQEKFPSEYDFLVKYKEGVYGDFRDILLKNGQVCGFAILRKEGWEYLVHPEDQTTGLKYRLLPMNRAIISSLFTPEEAEAHYHLIKENLLYKDGARLLERPITYEGGESVLFKRAEQSAYFGREISLQYMHAHIRYIEALCQLGKSEDLQEALSAVSPVDIQKVISYASVRQSNMYFSSSDADFKTRKEAQEEYEKLRNQEIKVKGGWRLYSSGPGIFINQLISNVLGFRFDKGSLIIDPVIPSQWEGQVYQIPLTDERSVRCTIEDRKKGMHLESVWLNNEKLEGQRIDQPYRLGGLSFDWDQVKPLLKKESNDIILRFFSQP